MANNAVKPAVKTPASRYQTSGNDSINWGNEMATKFYDLSSVPALSRDTSGTRMYGDADLTMLSNMPNRSYKG
jgi:hypothetical protein